MTQLRIFILLALFFFIAACQSAVYDHHIAIPSYTWERSNKLVYKIDIKEPLEKATVWLNVRHATELPYPELLLNVKLTTPDGEKGTRALSVPIKDKNGKNAGSGMGDMWDVKTIIQENASFKVGAYEIELSHQMPEDPVFMLVDIGVKVEKGE